MAEVGIEDLGTTPFGANPSLRWVLIHMIEETARRAGHMDIVRELIDAPPAITLSAEPDRRTRGGLRNWASGRPRCRSGAPSGRRRP
ncbi:DUF664 domain-containing protein [Streptomyces sp. NPDC050395]|uniref:mycothiol transferase n=1 Tax=Streptomyces sp. NPDC050395 TaxID=3155401 RepID=UPI0034392333